MKLLVSTFAMFFRNETTFTIFLFLKTFTFDNTNYYFSEAHVNGLVYLPPVRPAWQYSPACS